MTDTDVSHPVGDVLADGLGRGPLQGDPAHVLRRGTDELGGHSGSRPARGERPRPIPSGPWCGPDAQAGRRTDMPLAARSAVDLPQADEQTAKVDTSLGGTRP